MPFELTQEQKDIYRAAKQWAERKVDEEYDDSKIRELNEDNTFARDLYKEAIDLGFIGSWIPEEYGGQGLGVTERALIVEALTSVDPIFGQLISGGFGLEYIYLHGNEEQKERFISEWLENKCIFANAYTEPQAGTDVAAIKTRARKEDDEWVINGNKVFNTNADYADYDTVLCITDPEAKEEKRYSGMSAIVVETDQKGFNTTKIEKMGLDYLSTCEVGLNDVRAPEENLIGEEGRGFYQALSTFDFTRPFVAARSVGLAQCAFNEALDYIKEREVFDKTLDSYQDVRFKIAEMRKGIEGAKYLTYRAAHLIDELDMEEWRKVTSDISIAKLRAGEVVDDVVKKAILLHGGYGYTKDYKIERLYRDALAYQFVEGTAEATKTAIARDTLS